MNELMESQINIDSKKYTVCVSKKKEVSPEAPRIAVVSYLPNEQAKNMLEVCLDAIKYFTEEEHEVWVIDNKSPDKYAQWLLERPKINVILNQTEPTTFQLKNLILLRKPNQTQTISYANGVALEIAARLIDQNSHYLMTLHSDAMPSQKGWLSFLRSKLNGKIRAAGVRIDCTRTPEGILHILGCLFDFRVLKSLNLTFMPSLPQYDVGDKISVGLRKAGFDIFSCKNTIWEPELVETIAKSSPFRNINVDRSFNDDGEVIFLHLGRGTRKSLHYELVKNVTAEEWVAFAREHLLI